MKEIHRELFAQARQCRTCRTLNYIIRDNVDNVPNCPLAEFNIYSTESNVTTLGMCHHVTGDKS